MTYQPDETVSHIREGVCRITSISELSLTEDDPKTYYILTPVYDRAGKIYVPLDKADIFLRPLLNKEEILALIRKIPTSAAEWIPDEKARVRALQQNMKTGSHEVMISMLSMLYQKRNEILEKGKKFHASDERFLKEAEKTITREFAYVLGIDPGEVFGFIQHELGEA